jgi:hypothetical protein
VTIIPIAAINKPALAAFIGAGLVALLLASYLALRFMVWLVVKLVVDQLRRRRVLTKPWPVRNATLPAVEDLSTPPNPSMAPTSSPTL